MDAIGRYRTLDMAEGNASGVWLGNARRLNGSPGQPDNSDGQKFLAHDGASLIVHGSNNALDESLKKMLADTGSRLADPSGKVTYKMLKANWFVVSG
jgi:hypothetical protein